MTPELDTSPDSIRSAYLRIINRQTLKLANARANSDEFAELRALHQIQNAWTELLELRAQQHVAEEEHHE